MAFLPVNRDDMNIRGWSELDFLYISGDAYVDHPSFGHSIISRVLEKEGFRVGIIPQPDWRNTEDFVKMGRPRLGVLISSGVIDSMVNHYTAAIKPRGADLYSPGGKKGFRPDRAVIVYANRIREAFGDIPVIIGGVEASLRRFAHYDYWDDRVRRSVLLDSKADILIYGMGEKPIVDIAKLLDKGAPVGKIRNVRGTCVSLSQNGLDGELLEFIQQEKMEDEKYSILNSFEEVRDDKVKYAESFMKQSEEQDFVYGKTLIQKHINRYLVQNPPIEPMTEKEMDRIYALPYERNYHPMYEKDGGIPAIDEVKFSVVSHRGCFGGCSFCALNFHQGRVIQRRSEASILTEAQNITYMQDFKGYIHDVGGPTANFRAKSCLKQEKDGVCKDRQCLYPTPCKNLIVSHKEYLGLLNKIREIPGIKKVFIRSGIRYDYLMLDKDDSFFKSLVENHVSGQLKVAPEHISSEVLQKMGKPSQKIYDSFYKKYFDINKKLNKEQYLVPYLLSSHPGSTMKSAIALAQYLKGVGFNPEQVQDFYPTPGTLSTCMFYTGIDPRTMEEVYIPRSFEEKQKQRAMLQFSRNENHSIIVSALKEAGREDLIGFTPNSLVRPRVIGGFNNKSFDGNKQGASKFGKTFTARKTGADKRIGDRSTENRKSGNDSQSNRVEDNRKTDSQRGDSRNMDKRNDENRRPDVARTDSKRTDNKRTDSKRSDSKRTDTRRPDTRTAEGGRPEARRTGTGRPDTRKPDTRTAEGGRPEARRTGTGKPDTRRPDTRTAEGGRPEAKKANFQGGDGKKRDNRKFSPKGKEPLRGDMERGDTQRSLSQGKITGGADAYRTNRWQDTRGQDSKKPDSRRTETRGDGSKRPDSRRPDTRGDGSKRPDSRRPDTRGDGSKRPDSRRPDTRGDGSKRPDSRRTETRGTETRNSETRGSGSWRPASRRPETRGTETRGTETRGTETRGTETRGGDSRRPEPRGTDSGRSASSKTPSQRLYGRKDETRGGDNRNSETGSSDTRSVESRGSETRGSDNKRSSTKRAATKRPSLKNTGSSRPSAKRLDNHYGEKKNGNKSK